MLFNASGYVINSSIDGCIQMKSYLHGNPPLKLMLNEDLCMVGTTNTSASVIL
jgi:AP-4 complex subunit mu-1